MEMNFIDELILKYRLLQKTTLMNTKFNVNLLHLQQNIRGLLLFDLSLTKK